MHTAECEGIEETGALLAEACAARVVSVEPIAGSHNVKAVVETGRYGEKIVVCGAPNCRAGMLSVYVPLGKKVDPRRRERRHAGQRRGTRHQSRHAGILELTDGIDSAARPTASSRSTTSPSRTARICGATTAWRAKWRPSLRQPLRDPVQPSLVPHGAGAHRRRDRRSGPLPAIQRAGVRQRHRAAVAAVAAVPAHRHRPEPHQQHRGHDQLHHVRTGAAHARLRSRPAARRYHLRSPRARRRILPALERAGLHARARRTW